MTQIVQIPPVTSSQFWQKVKQWILTRDGIVGSSAKPDRFVTKSEIAILDLITQATGGAFDIKIGSAAGNDFTIDTDKLVVEGDTGNVGCATKTPLGALSLGNKDEGGTAKLNYQVKRELHILATTSTSDTTINIPSGAMLLGASFCVNVAIITSGSTNTWDADYIGGSTTNLVTAGASGAKNTKANRLIVPETASAQTNIQFGAPGAETFTAGVIEIITYYMDLNSLADT